MAAKALWMVMVLAGSLALPGCSGDEPAAAADAVVDWDDPSRVAEFEGGWAVRACEGDAPLLCVDKDGAPVGVVEAAAFPVASFPDLEPAGDDDANLRALAAGFQEALRTDRAAGCGADYRFEPIEPEPFEFGGADGLAYGFSGTRADGKASELNLQYSTISGDQIVSVTAIAYDEGGCPGRDDLSSFDSATLAEFRPYLEAVLAATPVPAVG